MVMLKWIALNKEVSLIILVNSRNASQHNRMQFNRTTNCILHNDYSVVNGMFLYSRSSISWVFLINTKCQSCSLLSCWRDRIIGSGHFPDFAFHIWRMQQKIVQVRSFHNNTDIFQHSGQGWWLQSMQKAAQNINIQLQKVQCFYV